MRDSGFISNRIFDALASGTVVVSDQVLGLSEIFGDLVPTYSDGSELQEIVTGLLADNDRRKEIARQATALVAAEHTFSRRAEQLIGLLLPLIGDRQKDLEGGRFEMSISNSSDRVESFPAVPSDEGTETVGHRQRSPD
jgi:spore maturation protein CgeB